MSATTRVRWGKVSPSGAHLLKSLPEIAYSSLKYYGFEPKDFTAFAWCIMRRGFWTTFRPRPSTSPGALPCAR